MGGRIEEVSEKTVSCTVRAGRVWVVGSHKVGKVCDEASTVRGVVPVDSVDWEGVL